MKTSLTRLRRTAQWAVNARMGRRQPSVLMNSIPKSGTHLVKAVLEGAGHQFAGHYGQTEQRYLSMPATSNPYFATAHIAKPVTGPGLRLLVYRDPVDVALSMVVYIRSRPDHPRSTLLADMPLTAAVTAVFEGIGDLEPLADRYAEMRDWARASDARPVDFDTVKTDPASLLHTIGTTDFDTDAVHRAMGKWNPTKRSTRSREEIKIKETLRHSSADTLRKTIDVYQEIKSLT